MEAKACKARWAKRVVASDEPTRKRKISRPPLRAGGQELSRTRNCRFYQRPATVVAAAPRPSGQLRRADDHTDAGPGWFRRTWNRGRPVALPASERAKRRRLGGYERG